MMKQPRNREGGDTPSTRHSLIERAKLGDSAAWTVLHARYRGLICGHLTGMGVPADAIDDVVQEILVAFSVGGALQRFKRASKFRTFLHGCVRNASLKWFEKERQRNRPFARDAAAEEVADHLATTPDAAFCEAFDRDTVESAVAAVRAQYERRGEAELFEPLFECLDKTRRELRAATARKLGFNEDVIRTRIHRLRKDIQAALRQHLHDVIPDQAEASSEYERLARPYGG